MARRKSRTPPRSRSRRRNGSRPRRRLGVAFLLIATAVLIFGGGLLVGLLFQGEAAESDEEASTSSLAAGGEARGAEAREAPSTQALARSGDGSAGKVSEASPPRSSERQPQEGEVSELRPSEPEPGTDPYSHLGTATGPLTNEDLDVAADAPLAPGGGARVALVIDDLGRSLAEVETLGRLGIPLSYAVLPFESRTAEVVAVLAQRRAEILLHLPMEPSGDANPGPGALTRSMSEGQLRRGTVKALEAVREADGVNNHMGSGFTSDARGMNTVLDEVRRRDLFFLDSRTSPASVGYERAVALGVPAAERQVFLDGDADPRAIRLQFRRLLELARTRGAAIAIGHPYPATLEVLAQEVPRAREQGYEFVPVSYLLDRSDGDQETSE